MSVSVEISPIFSRYTGNQVNLKANGSTVGECLQDLVRQYPDLKKVILDPDGNLYHSFDVFINGQSAYPKPMARPVKDGDKLYIMMLIQGG
jgi:molybdopterin converting factor small subunit